MSGQTWFRWAGKKSTEYGVYVEEMPPITRPNERVTFETVPGRSGALNRTEGKDVYDDLILNIGCVVKNGENLSEIMKWLKGYGELELANRPGGVYYGRVSNQIPFDKVLRGRENRRFTVVFRVAPFWTAAGMEAEMTNGGSVTNPGSVYACPTVTVTGTGDGTLMIGQSVVELIGMTGKIILNSALQEAYDDEGASLNAQVAGEFPTLDIGLNGVSWDGGITGVSMQFDARYL